MSRVVEPYYSVLSHPQFLSSHIDESRGAFFESGEREVEHLIEMIRAHGRYAGLSKVLELGCGPGRLLPALATRGYHITAVDRSAAMLELAKDNAARYGASSIEFVSLETFAAQTSTFDLMIVSRVLQQMNVAEGLDQLRSLTERLAPEGFLYLNVAFHSSRSLLSRAALALRKAMPPLNALANRLRHRPGHVPVIVPAIYPLDEVVLALHSGSCEVAAFHVERENELTTAHVLARKTGIDFDSGSTEEEAATTVAALPIEDYISPAELIRSVGIEELNARAERYFAGNDDWTQQLAKPFSTPADAPPMLVSLGVVLQGLALVPGMTVVDFGGGTGWLSRFLLQFGCRVVLCDVSASALRIATEFIDRQPPVGGSRENFRVSLFDGHHIDLADAEVDRILCFDSFHHVPNMEAALREFGRVLKPGGIAAFSEPGPEHSRSAQSQFEMRAYGVLENDVDVRRIWQIARGAGFADMRLLPFNGAPAAITLDEFEELLAGGRQLQVAARALRDFSANVRTFTLRKEGVEQTDSRATKGLSSEITVTLDAPVAADTPTPFTATVANTGTAQWLPSAASPGGVSLGAHLYRDGALVDFNFLWVPLGDAPVKPSDVVSVQGTVPPLARGRYAVEFDCVANGVTWFVQVGSRATRVEIAVD